MDILRILSRSTKLSNKSTKLSADKTTLPSAGVNANPQLFHDVVRGTKRKRGGDDGEEDVEEIDFFAEKTTRTTKEKNAKDKAKEAAKASASPPVESPQTLDESECRRILKSHRLKVTILSSKKSKKAIEPDQIFPQPLEAFSDLGSIYGIHGRLRDNLAEQSYKIPTEVQMGSLPLLINARTAANLSSTEVDLLAVAPTGSGKTMAFLIPVANQILQRRRTMEEKQRILEAVIVAPTKELASQIVNEAKKLCLGTGIKVTGMRKNMKLGQADVLESDSDSETEQPITKTDILVTTPGLLSSSSTALPTVRTLVLDEADILLDPLFREQTLGIWTACTNTSLRVTLWSATMGSNIESLALSTIQTRRSTLSIKDKTPTVRVIVGLKDSAIPNITHTLTYTATEPGKLLALRQLLHPSSSSTSSLRPPFLVFTQTIPRAIALHSELLYDIPPSAGGSSRLAVLHSSLSDPARAEIMRRFRAGEVWILITTDILSRGVDFKGLNGVVNYDVPNSPAAYIHRVGRTGRAGRDGGVAVTFYTKEDIPYVKGIANVIAVSEKQAGKPESESSVQKWLLNALPAVGKEKKKQLRLHGVEARRDHSKSENENGQRKNKMLISTKSGYERKLEHRRKGAIEGSKRRAATYGESNVNVKDDGEWGGFDD